MDMLDLVQTMKFENPSLSERCIVSALERVSSLLGRVSTASEYMCVLFVCLYIYPHMFKRVTITQTMFSDVLREHRFLSHELDKIGEDIHLKCPACKDIMFAAHTDGNRKLLRYKTR